MAAIRRKTPSKAAQQAAAAAVSGKYDAAGMGRRIRMWTPPSSGPNRAIDGLQKIRDRARDATRNDWAAASTVQKWVSNLFGVGITPRWEDEYLNTLWAKIVKEIDADGVSDAYALQALGGRTWLDGGEGFLRRRWRNVTTSRLTVPFQVQLIEGDYCPVFDSTTWPGMPAGNEIIQGIEVNKYGERIAYWFYKNHPGDKPSGLRPNALDLVRVPARDVSHIFDPLRPGQMRGVSTLASVLTKLRSAGDLEDAVLDRQKLANLFVAFLKKQIPDDWDDFKTDEETGLPSFWMNGKPIAALEPGIMQELAPGEEVQFANPPEAGTTYSDFMRTTHMGTASAGGIPYELMAGDLKDISDRTLRIAVNEFRRLAEQRQWHVAIPKICRPMVEWAAEAGVLNGAIPLRDLEKAKNPEWSPHGWPDIHPTQDIEGRIKARDAGFISTSSVIARSGEDRNKVLRERKRDEADGLTPAPPPKPGVAAEPPPRNAPPQPSALEQQLVTALADMQAARMREASQARGDTPTQSAVLEQAIVDMTAMIGQQMQSLVTLAASFSGIAQALAERPNLTEVKTTVLPAPVNNTVNVEPTPVSIENHTHVAPTPVEIKNEVTVAPDLNVLVELPDRQITTDLIDRDDDGNLKKVVQTETTLKH